jgi:hypothetical protein
VKTKTVRLRQLEIHVKVKQKDIDEGLPCSATLCMEKIAIARSLDIIDPEQKNHHKVRVDAGHIKFNMKGYRWLANTPLKAKTALIKFDDPEQRPKVRPHSYTLIATRMSKIVRMPPARQHQINEARRKRVAAGTEKVKRYTLRERIVGFDLGHG